MSAVNVSILDKIVEKQEQITNLAYENRKMGDFLAKLGLTIDDITDIVINSEEQLNLNIIKKIKNKANILERRIVKDTIFQQHNKIKV